MASLDYTSADAPALNRGTARWGWAAGCLIGLGATIGVALDHMHVASGTVAYPLPFLFGQAWWAFPLFAVAPVPLGLARPAMERLLGVPVAPPTWGATVSAMTLFVGAYLISGLLPGGLISRSAAIGAIFFTAWWLADRRPVGLLLAAAAAIGGTAFEVVLVAAGEFSHSEADVLGVAGWLPLLYATAGVSLGALGSRLVDGGAPRAHRSAP